MLTRTCGRYNLSANERVGEMSQGRVYKEKNNMGLKTKLWKIPQPESRKKKKNQGEMEKWQEKMKKLSSYSDRRQTGENFKVDREVKTVKGPCEIRTVEKVLDTLTSKLPGHFQGHKGVPIVYCTCALKVTLTLVN